MRLGAFQVDSYELAGQPKTYSSKSFFKLRLNAWPQRRPVLSSTVLALNTFEKRGIAKNKKILTIKCLMV